MSGREYVPVVALVGGVGSGKSAVARFLESGGLDSSLRFVDVNADEAGHEALTRSNVKEQIRNRFGADVFAANGEVSRPALAAEVFGDTDAHRTARSDLEAIVHPVIRETLETQIEEVRTSGVADVVLLDAAVLLEAGWQDVCDAVVFIDTPRETRVRRVFEQRRWNEETLVARESSQLDLETKRRSSDAVIDNSGPLDESAAQLLKVIESVNLKLERQP